MRINICELGDFQKFTEKNAKCPSYLGKMSYFEILSSGNLIYDLMTLSLITKK